MDGSAGHGAPPLAAPAALGGPHIGAPANPYHAGSTSPGVSYEALMAERAAMQQHLEQMQAALASAQQRAQQAEQAHQAQQSTATSDMMRLAQLHTMAAVANGQLDQTFSGDGALTGLAALNWTQAAEARFRAHRLATGMDLTDEQKLAWAVRALRGNALSWFQSLPSANAPAGWADFRSLFMRRWQMAASLELLERRLRDMSANARKASRPLSISGLNTFIEQFCQLADQIDAADMEERSKTTLLIEALHEPLRTWAFEKRNTYRQTHGTNIDLRTLASDLLQRTTNRTLARDAADGAGPSSRGSDGSDAMDVNAIALATELGISGPGARALFGWSADEKPRSGEDGDATGRRLEELTRQVSALALNAMSRRNVPSSLQQQIPKELLDARRDAGLCVRCGVRKYAPGAKGHSSRTCRAAPDAKTTAAEGLRKAESDQSFQ